MTSAWVSFTTAGPPVPPLEARVSGPPAAGPGHRPSAALQPAGAAGTGLRQPYSGYYPTYYPPTREGPRESNCNNLEGDPVDCGTGLFVHSRTDLYLPDVMPLALTRTYRTDVGDRPFGKGATHAFEIFLWRGVDSDQYMWADLYLADGAKIHYNRITPGSDYSNCVMEHISTPGPFHRSILSTNDGMYWTVTLRNGTPVHLLPV